MKDVDAELQVGGPALSPGYRRVADRFADFVGPAVPIDFVSRHAYTSGPAQHVPFGTHQTLAPGLPLLEQFARPATQLRAPPLAGLPVHITEFNSSYRPDNPIHDTAFHAAYLAPVLAARRRPCRLVLLLDVQRHVRGDRRTDLPLPRRLRPADAPPDKKPTYHLYAFMARMGEHVLARGADHLVTRHGDGRVTVLAWAPVDPTGGEPVDGHTLRLSLPVGARGRTAPPSCSARR